MKTSTKFWMIFTLLALFFVLPNFAWAAPVITSATPVSTFSHNAVVNVFGSGFGTKLPVAPAFWDAVTYDGLSNGDVVPVGTSQPWRGFCGSVAVYYKTTNPRGKWTAHYSNEWSTGEAKKGALSGFVLDSVAASKKLYFTWWSYFGGSPNPAFCQESNGATQHINEACSSDEYCGGARSSCWASYSNKFYRLVSADWATPNEGTIIWTASQFFAYAFTNDPGLGGGWVNWRGNYPAWNRMETYVDSTGSQSPEYTAWTNNKFVATYDSNPSQSWVIKRLDCLGFDGSNTPWDVQPSVDFGEVYADNTLARVEICNADTKAGSNHCEIQLPQTTWLDGQLQITVNQGSFADAASAFLYVIDANGDTNFKGFAVNFGGSCIPSCIGSCGGSDGCTGTCPDTCVAPQTCGGGGVANVCGSNTLVTDIILDNTDPNCTSTGTWTASTHYPDFYGVDYRYSANSLSDTFTWTTNRLEPGSYNVLAWWTADSTRPADVSYTIEHASGNSSVIDVDQRAQGGQWVRLGTYAFNNAGTVTLADSATGTGGACADAVRFTMAESLCGNGSCDAELGEDCNVCADDCVCGADAGVADANRDDVEHQDAGQVVDGYRADVVPVDSHITQTDAGEGTDTAAFDSVIGADASDPEVIGFGCDCRSTRRVSSADSFAVLGLILLWGRRRHTTVRLSPK